MHNHTNLIELPHPGSMLIVEALDYNNPYDYKRMHRHDYYEVILVNSGVGNQIIDFSSYSIQQGDIYLVYPGQVHLMHRNTANGLVIQFRKNIFEYIFSLKHYNLYNNALYKYDTTTFNHLFHIAEQIKDILSASQTLTSFSKHKALSYLQIILLTLAEQKSTTPGTDKERNMLDEYLSLITTHIYDKKKVTEYAQLLNCSADKLNEVCKKAINQTASSLIQEALLMEIRRLLLMNEMSLKEIAFHLNFDSQSNFSGFVKNHTNLSPTELQNAVWEIYK